MDTLQVQIPFVVANWYAPEQLNCSVKTAASRSAPGLGSSFFGPAGNGGGADAAFGPFDARVHVTCLTSVKVQGCGITGTGSCASLQQCSAENRLSTPPAGAAPTAPHVRSHLRHSEAARKILPETVFWVK